MLLPPADILFEDNHLLVVNKRSGQLVQGDKTGNLPLSELFKDFIKLRDHKPGNVFLGVVHRIDRPVSGVCLFAKTGKSLARLNEAFRSRETSKFYWAVVHKQPPLKKGKLVNWLKKNEAINKSRIVPEGTKDALEAILDYELIASNEGLFLLQIRLHTGRHHQIRVQLAGIGCPITGDTKYGGKSLEVGKISLHARILTIQHPVKKEECTFIAPMPDGLPWSIFKSHERITRRQAMAPTITLAQSNEQ